MSESRASGRCARKFCMNRANGLAAERAASPRTAARQRWQLLLESFPGCRGVASRYSALCAAVRADAAWRQTLIHRPQGIV